MSVPIRVRVGVRVKFADAKFRLDKVLSPKPVTFLMWPTKYLLAGTPKISLALGDFGIAQVWLPARR